MDPILLLDHDAPEPGAPLHVRLLLTVAGRVPDDRSRVPLNLSLVLDRSGSMALGKLHAAVEAARLLVQRLWPDDRVSVVAYDDTVTVVAPPGRSHEQAGLADRLRALEPGGMTNLSGGWLRGRELVAAHLVPGGVNRILLLTDGMANLGITDRDTLAGLCRAATAQGITTTTLGFGEGFDEALLRSMADSGGGATYFIEDADRAAPVFDEELEGLLSLTAQNLTATVRTRGPVRLAAVHHSYPSAPVERGVRLEMGDLYAREPRRLLVELEIDRIPDTAPEAAGEEDPSVEVARVRLAGDVLLEGGGVERRTVDVPVLVHPRDGARVEPEVRRELLYQAAARAREEAMERERRGDAEAAAATLESAAARIRGSEVADEGLRTEADDMEALARRAREVRWDATDAKYMAQRSYDMRRSRKKAAERVRRKVTPPTPRGPDA